MGLRHIGKCRCSGDVRVQIKDAAEEICKRTSGHAVIGSERMGTGGIHCAIPQRTDGCSLLPGFQIDVTVILTFIEASSGILGRCVSHDIPVIQRPLAHQAEVRSGAGRGVGLSVQTVGRGISLNAVEHSVFRHHNDAGVIGIVIDVPVKEHQISRFWRILRCLFIEVHFLELLHAIGHQGIVRNGVLFDSRLIGTPGGIHGTPGTIGKAGAAFFAGIQDRGIPLPEFRQIIIALRISQLRQGHFQDIFILIPGVSVCVFIRSHDGCTQHSHCRCGNRQHPDAFFYSFHTDSSNVFFHSYSFYYNNFAILRQPVRVFPLPPNQQNVQFFHVFLVIIPPFVLLIYGIMGIGKKTLRQPVTNHGGFFCEQYRTMERSRRFLSGFL